MDKISVAMATYNGERFLREQLDSLYNQTRLPDEVVVTDDCSSDNTAGILEEYHQKYGLKYIVNQKSLGVNKNFEKAIRTCTGDYIMICDQDDIWIPEKIDISLKKLKEVEEDKPAMVTSQCYHINANGELITKKKAINKDTFTCADTLLHPPGVTQGCTIILNRSLLSCLKPFPTTSACMYDAYIGFTCSCIGVKYNLSSPLMYYRHHENNVSAPYSKSSRNILGRMLAKMVKNLGICILPADRVTALKTIYDEYSCLFTEEAKYVMPETISYLSQRNILRRILLILKIKGLTLRYKLQLTFGDIIYNYLDK